MLKAMFRLVHAVVCHVVPRWHSSPKLPSNWSFVSRPSSELGQNLKKGQFGIVFRKPRQVGFVSCESLV